jgi:hypothetical protein
MVENRMKYSFLKKILLIFIVLTASIKTTTCVSPEMIQEYTKVFKESFSSQSPELDSTKLGKDATSKEISNARSLLEIPPSELAQRLAQSQLALFKKASSQKYVYVALAQGKEFSFAGQAPTRYAVQLLTHKNSKKTELVYLSDLANNPDLLLLPTLPETQTLEVTSQLLEELNIDNPLPSQNIFQPSKPLYTDTSTPPPLPGKIPAHPWQRIHPRLEKGEKAPLWQEAQTITHDEHFYKNLIILVDYDDEKIAGALTLSFIQAIDQKATTIIVPKNILFNYLNIAHCKNYSMRIYAYLLSSFDLTQWDIYERDYFYLFIPKQYALANVSFNAPPDPKTKKVNLIGTTTQELQQDLLNKCWKSINFFQKIKNISGSFGIHQKLLSDIQAFFTMLTNADENAHSSWVIFLSGHGQSGIDCRVAGLNFDDFVSLVQSLSSTSFLYCLTCYGGGRTLKTLKKYFEDRNIKPNFIIAMGSIGDSPAYCPQPQFLFSSSGATIQNPTINFNSFFSSTAAYLNGILQGKENQDPLNTIFNHTYQEASNTPQVWIPSSGYMKAIPLSSHTRALTKSIIQAKSHEKENIDLQNTMGLLYAQELPQPLYIDKTSSVLSMSDERIYLMQKMIIEGSQNFSIFYGKTDELYNKLMPTLFLINEWEIEGGWSTTTNKHIPKQCGTLMVVIVKDSGAAFCAYEKESTYYKIDMYSTVLFESPMTKDPNAIAATPTNSWGGYHKVCSFGMPFVDLELISKPISHEEFIAAIKMHINANWLMSVFQSPLLNKFLPNLAV